MKKEMKRQGTENFIWMPENSKHSKFTTKLNFWEIRVFIIVPEGNEKELAGEVNEPLRFSKSNPPSKRI